MQNVLRKPDEAFTQSDSLVNRDQISKFRREGWMKIDGLLGSEALVRVRGALKAAVEADSRFAGEKSYRDDPRFRQMYSNLRVPAAQSRDLNIGWDPRIAGIARDLLGVPHVQLFTEGPLVKPPAQAGSRMTRWHQDLPLQPFDRKDALTVWIAVEDVPLEQGPLAFLPGSHRVGPIGRRDMRFDEEADITTQLTPEDAELVGKPVCQALKAGDATIHSTLVLHSAGRNTTDRPRYAWAVTYMSADTLYTGASSGTVESGTLKINERFDPELYPIIV